MDKKQIIVIPTNILEKEYQRIFLKKEMLPLGKQIGYLNDNAKINIRLKFNENIVIDEECHIFKKEIEYYLKLTHNTYKLFTNLKNNSKYIYFIFEGSNSNSRSIIVSDSMYDTIFEEFEKNDPSYRLEAYNLPPIEPILIDTPNLLNEIYNIFSSNDEELFSVRTNKFIRSPHILTHLFAHVMNLKSRDHINYISTLRVLADQLREMLKGKIKKIVKNHNIAWSQFYGSNITFVDGGMSRIVSIPGLEPMGIRVGIYTVTPGERNLEEREKWKLFSTVIGDVLNETPYGHHPSYETDTRRLLEASRYILEPLYALHYYNESKTKPEVIFIHGPLQNKFEIYDGESPNFIPGVSSDFLKTVGISKEDIERDVPSIPTYANNRSLWNDCIPVYLYILKKIFNLEIPFVGVVERAHSISYTDRILDNLIEENIINARAKKEIKEHRDKYGIGDEFLFGCILDEGEYIDLIPLRKNNVNDAHDIWKPVVTQFPQPYATMLKVSANNFPFRVEFNNNFNNTIIEKTINLLYHTSLLLPNYAFPVGIDIVDKYAKIPDWLSKGISSNLTTNILYKVLQQGDDRLLRTVRQILARSPRDFFFRPKP